MESPMKQLLLAVAATLVAGSALAQPAQVTVRADSGVVSVQGESIAVGGNGVSAEEGAVVTVAQGGHATVTFTDGCKIEVNDQLVIPSSSPCAKPAIVTIPAESDTPLVIAGIAGLVGVGLAVGTNGGGGSDTPSSP